MVQDKMEEENNLSKKIDLMEGEMRGLRIGYVREFIKQLKDRFSGGPTGEVDLEFINKLAGEDLI